MQAFSKVFTILRRKKQHKAEKSGKEDLLQSDEYSSVEEADGKEPELPTIIDRGEYSEDAYPDEDLFWNSIMVSRDDLDYSSGQNKDGEKGRYARRKSSENYNKREREVPPKRGYASGQVQRKAEEEQHNPSLTKNLRARGFQGMDEDVERTSRFSTPDGSAGLSAVETSRRHSRKTVDRSLTPTPNSREWNESMGLPANRSCYIYRNGDGQRRVVLPKRSNFPRKKTVSSDEIGTARPQSPSPHPKLLGGNVASVTRKDDALTWNVALNKILRFEHVDPAIKVEVLRRLRESQTTNGDVKAGEEEKAFINGVDVGLVPNFSYPIQASKWYGKKEAGSLPNGVPAGFWDDSEDEAAEPKSSSNPKSPLVPPSRGRSVVSNEDLYRDPTPPGRQRPDPRQRPSGLAPVEQVERLHRFLGNEDSTTSITPPSPTTLIRCHESTIATQADMIRGLHRKNDRLVQEMEMYKEAGQKLAERVDQKQNALRDLKSENAEMKREMANVKILTNFANKILGGCFVRETEVVRTIDQIKSRRERNRASNFFGDLFNGKNGNHGGGTPVNGDMPEGYQWAMFGDGPDPPGTKRAMRVLRCRREEDAMTGPGNPTSAYMRGGGNSNTLSKRELEALERIARQNVRILREDVTEMAHMAGGLTRDVTGIQPPSNRWMGMREWSK